MKHSKKYIKQVCFPAKINMFVVDTIKEISSATLPTKYGNFRIVVFKSLKDGLEHTALVKGEKLEGPVLVRVHSECLTGDVFSSLRCDCGPQLVESLKRIGKAKNGVLIYLNQEGRGIGLSNKIKAYFLAELRGYDTVEANSKLGFAADPREYKVAAQILKCLNVREINLLTNNPDKVSQLVSNGIKIIKRIPLEITPNKLNRNYLLAKKQKLGHKLTKV